MVMEMEMEMEMAMVMEMAVLRTPPDISMTFDFMTVSYSKKPRSGLFLFTIDSITTDKRGP